MVGKVLITSVGSGVGYGILRALQMYSASITIVGVNSVSLSAGVFQCDKTYLVPPTTHQDEYKQALFEILEIEKPEIIFPGRDADLPVLASMKTELQSMGVFLLTGSEKSIQICTNKYRTAQLLRNAGHPFASTGCSYDEVFELSLTYGFPLIIKPINGFGSNDVRIAWRHADLANYAWENGKWIAQKYLIPAEWNCPRGSINPDQLYASDKLIQDNEYSVQILLGYEEVLGVFASKNTLMYGMPFIIEVVDDPTLISKALAIAHSLQEQGLIGPCNLQAKKDVDDGFVFFEVNARFTGITPVRTQMGFNEVIAAYYYFVHHQLPVDCLSFRSDQLACRFLSESIFTKKDIENLLTEKKWVKEIE